MTRAADLAKLIAGGGTITVDDNSDTLTLESTDADANVGPVLNLHRNSASPADNDLAGRIVFKADDDAGNAATFARIEATATDVSNGSEDGRLDFFTAKDDAFTAALSVLGTDVGIGTTSPSQKLVVSNTSGSISSLIQTSASGTGNLLFGDTDSDTSGRVQYNHSSNYLAFYANGSERLRVLSGGGLTFNGDTATANALDDYEEGTWTPALVGPSSVAYSSQIGNYTKIGRMVFFSFSMTFSTAPTGNSNYRILIPFTPEGTSTREYGGDVFMDTALVTSNYGHFLGVYNGSTNVYVYTSTGSARSGSGAWQTGTLSGHIFINT